MAKRYDINKSAKVGEEIICPVCGKKFVKKSYQQAFCSTLCKDKYHNQRRKNNGYFSRYNVEHPHRLERIGIDVEKYLDMCLGDDECESLAQITMDEDCDFENWLDSERMEDFEKKF